MELLYAKKFRLPPKSANVLQTMNMAMAFAAAGARVRCFPGCDAPSATAREEMLLDTLRLIAVEKLPPHWNILPGAHKGLYGLHFRWAVLRAMRAAPAAALYARDLGEARLLRLLTRFFPRTLIYEAHEILYLMQKNDGKAHWQRTRQQEEEVFRSIAGLVVVNAAVGEEAREHFGYAGPVLAAPNGYNPTLFHPLPLFDASRPWPGKYDPVTLVYVGAFHPGKGVRTLLNALGLLPERFHLRLIGGYPVSVLEELRSRAHDMQLAGRVDFRGAVAPHELRAACDGAHIFVIPQQSGFYFSPLKLYEAMAMGLPVVTTPLPLFAPHIEADLVHGAPDCGPGGLARAITELAAAPEFARRLREGGIREAAQRTWQKRAETILDFIRGVREG